MERELTGK